jgi:hypothetical protein
MQYSNYFIFYKRIRNIMVTLKRNTTPDVALCHTNALGTLSGFGRALQINLQSDLEVKLDP